MGCFPYVRLPMYIPCSASNVMVRKLNLCAGTYIML
ncbi:hypothetical protein CPT_Spivey_006 [Klebsiella phage Spivey]|uniref:Uncharacterized protein n=1 Tax=Klebsiella phage Spivey TaxID=2562542 RepID=A0A4D5ZF18_9CAUD|nr:hypothetical protein CPT_Spivey_009 [Klebsiella phage Spivey]